MRGLLDPAGFDSQAERDVPPAQMKQRVDRGSRVRTDFSFSFGVAERPLTLHIAPLLPFSGSSDFEEAKLSVCAARDPDYAKTLFFIGGNKGKNVSGDGFVWAFWGATHSGSESLSPLGHRTTEAPKFAVSGRLRSAGGVVLRF
jgi:hypothetical protein